MMKLKTLLTQLYKLSSKLSLLLLICFLLYCLSLIIDISKKGIDYALRELAYAQLEKEFNNFDISISKESKLSDIDQASFEDLKLALLWHYYQLQNCETFRGTIEQMVQTLPSQSPEALELISQADHSTMSKKKR